MCAKIIDKEKRRREIALSCAELLREVGIKKMTVSQVAQTAGIGKGTVYEYFKNKEDIIFEIINIYIEEHHNTFLENIKNVKTTKEKVFYFFNSVLDDSEQNQKHCKGYKEYLSIVLSDDNEAMKNFNSGIKDFLEEKLREIIKDGIDKKELIPEALELSDGLLMFEKGLTISKMTQDNFDVKGYFEKFISTLFKLIEVKK